MFPLVASRARPSACAALLVVAVLVGGCASSGASTDPGASANAEGTTDRSWSAEQAEEKLRAAADRWSGVPHEWGGTSTRGVDCSGLVHSIYNNIFRVSVPRTTEEQARAGQAVDRSSLRPGDLVFFRPKGKSRHVGIYLSDGEFLHASSSNGVAVSPLDRSYWADRWWQARRLLSYSDDAPSPPADDAAPPSTAAGW